jgi:hypothetical protein
MRQRSHSLAFAAGRFSILMLRVTGSKAGMMRVDGVDVLMCWYDVLIVVWEAV